MPEPNDGINKLRVQRQMLRWHQTDFNGTWNWIRKQQYKKRLNIDRVALELIHCYSLSSVVYWQTTHQGVTTCGLSSLASVLKMLSSKHVCCVFRDIRDKYAVNQGFWSKTLQAFKKWVSASEYQKIQNYKDWGLRIEVWGLRTEDWGVRTEDWGLRIEDWGLRTEDWGLRIENWGLRIEEWGVRSEEWGSEDWGQLHTFWVLRL